MFLVWKKNRELCGIYADKQNAFDVAIAVMGASYITEQKVEYGCVHPPTHWWFL